MRHPEPSLASKINDKMFITKWVLVVNKKPESSANYFVERQKDVMEVMNHREKIIFTMQRWGSAVTRPTHGEASMQKEAHYFSLHYY